MRLCILISAVCVVTAYGSVGPSGPCRIVRPEPGFDPQAVVRQVQADQDMPGPLPNDHGRVRGRPASRFPGFAELGVEQFPDNGEFLLDTNNAMVPAPGSQTEAAVGFDGANFLVVWQDLRGGNYSDICGARVTPDGTVLDPRGFVISQAAYEQRNPALAFDGTSFLVVWDDYRRGHAYDIYGTRVTTGGAVLDDFGIIIADAMNDQQCPAVAFDGANFLVAWQDNAYNVQQQDISGARVTQGGAVLDPEGFVISQASQDQYTPVIGFDGSNYLVAWTDCRSGVEQADIYGARVTPGGTVLDPQGFAIGNLLWAQSSPALAFDGTNLLVAWQDVNSGHTPPVIGVWGARVTPGGTVLDPSGIAIAESTHGTLPSLGFDGTNFLVVWYEVHGLVPAYFSIWGKRVTPAGTVLDSSGIVISAAAVRSQQSPVPCFGGANFLVVWQDDRNARGEPDIYGARVTPAGAVLDPGGLLVTQSARGQYTPALGFDGANFLAVWEDDRSGYTDIYGARVTSSGTVLDPAGIVISQAPSWQHDPVLAFDGTNFLVAWKDYRSGPENPDIYGARVTPGGAVLDPEGIAISDAQNRQYSPTLGFDGANFLVVWQDLRNGSYDIYATRVAPDGTVLSTDGFVITQASNWQCNPVLGFDGTSFLAVWEDYRNTPGLPDIYGTRVKPDGTVLDPDGIAVTRAANGQHNPTLGFDGTNYLVVWDDGRTSAWPDIYGARVTTGGTVLDTVSIAISRGSKDQFAPAVAFDGTNFLVVYEDYRGSNNPDIYGAWVSPAGVVSDEGSVLRPPGNQTCLALARGSGSLLFMAFQGWAGIVGGKAYNTDRIWGEMNPAPGGGVEEAPSVELRMTNVATVVRGVLRVPASSGARGASCVLLDASGRKVMDLEPGANDVRTLAPGVYFVRAASRKPSAVGCSKVVVTR